MPRVLTKNSSKYWATSMKPGTRPKSIRATIAPAMASAMSDPVAVVSLNLR